jgi:hypothetical protein
MSSTQFSAAIKLADVDDFFQPSQKCIKPLLNEKTDSKETTESDKKKVRCSDSFSFFPISHFSRQNKGTAVKIEMEIDEPVKDSHFSQIKTHATKKTATVSLNDCLACRFVILPRLFSNVGAHLTSFFFSGCVTSAETVLITQQSIEEFLTQVKAQKKTLIVSVSPQTRTALAVHFKLTELQVVFLLLYSSPDSFIHEILDYLRLQND